MICHKLKYEIVMCLVSRTMQSDIAFGGLLKKGVEFASNLRSRQITSDCCPSQHIKPQY